MKKIVILVLCAVLTNNLTHAQTASLTPLLIHFETDKANVSTDAANLLESAVAGLKGGPEKYRVEITAHTDLRGSLAYNQNLSRRRGEAVTAFLNNKGFKTENIHMVAEGETKPLVKDETDVALAENRRVEVRFIFGTDGLGVNDRNKVPAAKLKFQAEKGIKFESPRTGTRINIPAGILAKKDGTPVTGQVDLQFREYRNFGDFIASGIPMHYSDSQGDFFFNSGGMFEVRTFQNGEELTIIPGNTYTVNFKPTADLVNPNLFLFDNENQKWDYVSSAAFAGPVGFGDAIAGETSMPLIVSETDVIRNNTSLEKTPCALSPIIFPYNSDTLDLLMQSFRTALALVEGKDKIEPWFRKFANRSDAFFLASLERSSIELVGSFSSEFFPDDKSGVFTELLAFKDHYFESDSVDRTSIANLLNGGPVGSSNTSKSKVFKSLIVQYEGNGKCLLTLNDGESEIQVHAVLRMSSELISRSNHNDADEVMAKYNKLREERQGAIIDKIGRWRNFLNLAPLFQTPEETCMSRQQWLDYFDKNLPLMRKRYENLIANGTGSDLTIARAALKAYATTQQKVSETIYKRNAVLYEKVNALTRELQLSKFGTYNCDQIFRISKNPEFITASYKSTDGSTIKPLNISIIDRDTRMFFNSISNGKMYKLPGRKLDIVVTATDGRMYYLSAADYAKISFDQQETFTFTMNDVTGKVSTPGEWMTVLGI